MNYDNLIGGSRARLAKMRAYVKRWNSDPGHIALHTLLPSRADDLPAWKIARSHGAGAISIDAHGPKFDAHGGYCNIPASVLSGLRDRGATHEIVKSLPRGWYRDTFMDECNVGNVWQLPARNGEPRYIAGYLDEPAAYARLGCDNGRIAIFDCPEDAARGADHVAEHDAEISREYDERWQEAQRLDDRIADLRVALSEARENASEAIRALRELKATETPVSARMMQRDLMRARAYMRDVLGELADKHAARAEFADIET